MKTVLKGGNVLKSGKIERLDVEYEAGKITRMAPEIDSENVVDCQGLTILPGLIDTQVHFREPGLVHKEDLESGSRGAALGGVTGFFEMPNTNPSTTTPDALLEKVESAKKTSWVDFAFYMGASDENAEKLEEYRKTEGCCGVKIFMGSSTGNLLVTSDESLKKIFSTVKSRIAIHSEEEELLIANQSIRDAATTAHAHPEWRNVDTALKSTERLLKLAKETGKNVHVLHITTKDEMELLAQNKDTCTVEVTPQHLTLFAPDCYDKLGTYAQMNPPVREKSHLDGLWEGIANGTVDIIGSDHAPHTREEKDKGYPNTPSGMTGVQTIIPIMLDHVSKGRLTLQKLVELMCLNPAKMWNIENKGDLYEGRDADFTIVDMNKKHVIKDEWIASKSGWTPFNDVEVQGWPEYTIVRGNIVMEKGELKQKAARPLFR